MKIRRKANKKPIIPNSSLLSDILSEVWIAAKANACAIRHCGNTFGIAEPYSQKINLGVTLKNDVAEPFAAVG